MKIRKARKEDLKDIAELMIKEFNKKPFSEGWTTKNAIKTLNHYLNIKGVIYVCETGNSNKKELVGYIIFRWETDNKGDTCVIEELVVDSNFQRRGIGCMLIKQVESDCKEKNIQSIFLSTGIDLPAFDFYKKNGFIHQEKTVFMKKELR